MLSYPAFESYTLSNFYQSSYEMKRGLGREVKQLCNELGINQSNIGEATILYAANELISGINYLGLPDFNLDDMSEFNRKLYDFEKQSYFMENKYNLISLLTIAFLDLGLIECE